MDELSVSLGVKELNLSEAKSIIKQNLSLLPQFEDLYEELEQMGEPGVTESTLISIADALVNSTPFQANKIIRSCLHSAWGIEDEDQSDNEDADSAKGEF